MHHESKSFDSPAIYRQRDKTWTNLDFCNNLTARGEKGLDAIRWHQIQTRSVGFGEPYLNVSDSPLNLCSSRCVHAGENEPLLVVVLAQDFVVHQVETVAHAEPVPSERSRREIAGKKIKFKFCLFIQMSGVWMSLSTLNLNC